MCITFLCLLLAVAAVLALVYVLPAKQEELYPQKITFDYLGQKETYAREDILRDGTVLVDFGLLSRVCGFHIGGNKTAVTVSTDCGDIVEITDGERVVRVNGNTCRADLPARVDGANIWLPLRFVEQYVTGLSVVWKEDRSAMSLSRVTGSGAILSFTLKADTAARKVSSAGVRLQHIAGDEEFDYSFVTDVSAYLPYMNPQNQDGLLLFLAPGTPCAAEFSPQDLVNVKNVPKGTTQKLTECAAKALEAMLAEMAASSGIKNVNAVHAYVTYASQEKSFNNRVFNERYYFRYHAEAEGTYFSDLAYTVLGKSYLESAYISKGSYTLSAQDAEKVAAKAVAAPGTSDHQTGLGTDLSYGKSADKNFADTAAYAWLKENAYKFGFIERYPKEAEKMTGFDFEPYHWRFVGQYHAAVMHREGYSCLDEYLAVLGAQQ